MEAEPIEINKIRVQELPNPWKLVFFGFTKRFLTKIDRNFAE